MRERRVLVLSMAALIGALGLVRVSEAVELRLERAVEANVIVDRSDAPGASSPRTTGELRPEIAVYATGLNTEGSARLGLQFQTFSDDQANQLVPELDLTFETRPRQGPFRFNADARLSERRVNPLIVDEQAERAGAREVRVFTGRASPSLTLPLASGVDALARYELSGSSIDDDSVNDTTTHDVLASVRERGATETPLWSVDARAIRLRLSDRSRVDTDRLSASAGLPVSSELVVAGMLGVEAIDSRSTRADNDTLAVFENADRATIWDLGIEWRPSSRTTVRLGIGERFFGRRPEAEISHRTRSSETTLRWSRDVQRDSNRLATPGESDFSTGVDADAPSAPGDALAGEDGAGINQQFAVTEEILAAWALRGRVSTLGVETGWTIRETPGSDERTQVQRIETSFERRVSRRWLWRVAYEHARIDADAAERVTREHRVTLGVRVEAR